MIALFDMIPALLSKHEKRVVFSSIVDGTFAEQYAETFFWMTDSMIVNECRKTEHVRPGIKIIMVNSR